MIKEMLSGIEYRNLDENFPSDARAIKPDERWSNTDEESTTYGYVLSGVASVITNAGVFHLRPGCYFAAPGCVTVSGADVLAIIRRGFVGMLQLGGPIEQSGRLRYIDGCTDSLLIHPPKLGDPCLNHLHFPVGIRQTMHTHPSVRIGVVARGSGECVTPHGMILLRAGMFWYLPAEEQHCFYTHESTMDIVAWHPDSDCGPDDEQHPMVNRTIVDGVPARQAGL